MKKKNLILCLIIVLAIITVLFFVFNNDKNQNDFSNEIQNEWVSSIADNQPDFLNVLDDKSSFECISTESVGDGYYVVTANVSSPDISESINTYQKEVYGKEISEEEINKNLCELINSADLKTTEQKIDIIVDEDGNVRVQFNDDFINAMFGYAYIDSIETYMDEQINEKED